MALARKTASYSGSASSLSQSPISMASSRRISVIRTLPPAIAHRSILQARFDGSVVMISEREAESNHVGLMLGSGPVGWRCRWRAFCGPAADGCRTPGRSHAQGSQVARKAGAGTRFIALVSGFGSRVIQRKGQRHAPKLLKEEAAHPDGAVSNPERVTASSDILSYPS